MKPRTADLPLHFGHAPRWLFSRMVRLGEAISEVIIEEYGTRELLTRLADPFWFQAFSCVLGFDWHSSGTTTVTLGALKQADIPGIKIAGGKGKASLRTPEELEKISDEFSLSEKKKNELIRASRLTAKVDNALLQDGYSLYHHSVVVSEKGEWCIIQQGLNDRTSYARRYHWFTTKDFLNGDRSGIISVKKEREVFDVSAKESEENRRTVIDLVNDGVAYVKQDYESLKMPWKINWNVLEKIYELQPKDYEEFLEFRGVGPSTVRALSLIAKLIYGKPVSWKDPVKYSFAHGGKDGVPYPVNRRLMDDSILTLREALERAKIDDREKLCALKKLARLQIGYPE